MSDLQYDFYGTEHLLHAFLDTPDTDAWEADR